MSGRYYKIYAAPYIPGSYVAGTQVHSLVMEIWATSKDEAKKKARRTYSLSGFSRTFDTSTLIVK